MKDEHKKVILWNCVVYALEIRVETCHWKIAAKLDVDEKQLLAVREKQILVSTFRFLLSKKTKRESKS